MTDEVPTDSSPFSAIPRNCVTRDERERVIAPQATLRGASSRRGVLFPLRGGAHASEGGRRTKTANLSV
jgi:hypothetical protein